MQVGGHTLTDEQKWVELDGLEERDLIVIPQIWDTPEGGRCDWQSVHGQIREQRCSELCITQLAY